MILSPCPNCSQRLSLHLNLLTTYRRLLSSPQTPFQALNINSELSPGGRPQSAGPTIFRWRGRGVRNIFIPAPQCQMILDHLEAGSHKLAGTHFSFNLFTLKLRLLLLKLLPSTLNRCWCAQKCKLQNRIDSACLVST